MNIYSECGYKERIKVPRNRKQKRVDFLPEVVYFKPRGVLLTDLDEEILAEDELEALRLVDLEGKDQVEAAKKMAVSQSTLHRILVKARKKIARALILGRAIALKGGEEKMPIGRGIGRGRGMGRGLGMGGGRGRQSGQFAAGPGGKCVCTNPECGHVAVHQLGVPCYQQKCPKCGSPMIRQR